MNRLLIFISFGIFYHLIETFGVFFYSGTGSTDFNTFTLLAYLILSIVFVLINIDIIRLRFIEIALIAWLLPFLGFECALILFDEKPNNGSTLLVHLLGLLFLLKIAVIRHFNFNIKNLEIYFFRLAWVLFFLSASQLGFFFFYGLFYDEFRYFGLALPISFCAAYFVSKTRGFSPIFILVLAFLSGKRSHVLSLIISFPYFWFKNAKRRSWRFREWNERKITAMILSFCGLVFLFWVGGEHVSGKYANTLVALRELSITDLTAMKSLGGNFRLDGGRFMEISSAFMNFGPINWMFGSWTNTEYEYLNLNDGVTEMRHFIHVTPASLIFKYGIFFTLGLYWYILSQLTRALVSVKWLERFGALGLLILFVQSFFAFNVFVEPMLPLFIAIIIANPVRKN